MVYKFAKYPDETLVAFSDIRKKDNGEDYIKVSFERPTEKGFDTVIFELPSYEIIEQDGNYSEEEIKEFTDSIINAKNNAILNVLLVIFLTFSSPP